MKPRLHDYADHPQIFKPRPQFTRQDEAKFWDRLAMILTVFAIVAFLAIERGCL